jgi:hypothetical protein
MTTTIATILHQIETLTLPEQQEIAIALLDRVTEPAPLAFALGPDPSFANLDTQGKREALRQKLLSGLEQVKQGNITDGELVFEQLQAKLRRMSEQ